MGALYLRELGSSSRRITTATTTAVKSSAGVLRAIIVGTTAAGTITVNDSSGTLVVLKASIPEGVYPMNLRCMGKIEVVTGAISDITIVFD